jgi:hypothetical protein
MPGSVPSDCGVVPSATASLYPSAATFLSDACAFDVNAGGDARAAMHAFQGMSVICSLLVDGSNLGLRCHTILQAIVSCTVDTVRCLMRW